MLFFYKVEGKNVRYVIPCLPPNISKNALRLLKEDEIQELYVLPRPSDIEKQSIFSLNNHEYEIFSNLHTVSSKFIFILQLGFFKLKRRFYSLNELKAADESKEYVAKRYFSNFSLSEIPLQVTKPTRLNQQSLILELFNYKRYSREVAKLVENEALRLASLHAKPSYIIRELLRFLEREQIVIQAYSTLQNLIGMVTQKEISRLASHIDHQLDGEAKSQFDDLIENREKFLHDLTLLKRDPRDFSLTEIKEAIAKRKKLNELYSYINGLSHNLKISDQNLIYFSSLVAYYSIYKISRLHLLTRRLLLFCFIQTRYKMITDHLVKAFLYKVDKYTSEGKSSVQERIYRSKVNYGNKLKLAGKLLKLFIDKENFSYMLSFKEVRERAFSIIQKEEVDLLVSSLIKDSLDEKGWEWEEFDKIASKIRINLRPMLLSLSFESQSSSHSLKKAVRMFKENLKQGKPFIPKAAALELFNKKARKYLCQNGKANASRYEFQLYKTLASRIISGDIFIPESLSYRSFDADLIDSDAWGNKQQLINSLGLPKLVSGPALLLDDLEQELDHLYRHVNERIRNGENAHIKFFGKNEDKWTLPYLKLEESNQVDIFGTMPTVDLSSLLNLVNQQCEFTNCFTHILGRYSKSSSRNAALFAAVTACGTNMGLGKMSRNTNVSTEEIYQTYKNFIRPETLKSACDAITERIRRLPFFSDWHIDGENIYSSSDGQKFSASRSTQNARYSSKYFGLEKGVVSYTLNANYIPINSRIIGANEHESHYVLDVLLDNSSEVKPDIHTTDTHGSNQVNFALLYLFDYVFAPRYKNLPVQSQNLYCFGEARKYGSLFLRPKGKINRSLIEAEWDNILRIAVSLATKTTSQSTIIRKLSSYPRKNKTFQSLSDLKKVIKSIHLLHYIDRIEFRQYIQKALNRGESYHGLKRALFYDNLGKFRVSSEYEQNVWSECTRLLALSIIYYNSFILSQIATRRSNLGLNLDFLKDISPIQWRHVDLFGHFYFGEHPNGKEVNDILSAIEKMDFTLF